MANKLTESDKAIQLIEITPKLIFMFIYVPDGYAVTGLLMEGHTGKKLGKLNSFNRIKLMSHWKEESGCLVKVFTKILLKKGWDFNKHPNPTAIAFTPIVKNEDTH